MSMLPDLHGLHVDCGHYNATAHRWVREPFAEFTCRHGCTLLASGADEVTRLCRSVWAWHAATCPGKGIAHAHP